MFGNKALVLDEFRILLSAKVGYDEKTGQVSSPHALTHVATHMGVAESLVLLWVQGLARPTPYEENMALSLIKAVHS